MIDYFAVSLLLGLFVFFMILKTPITFSLIASSMITAVYLKFPLMWVLSNMVNGINSFSLMAIPFFILAGEIMGQGGISERLVKFSNLIVGRWRGGLGHVNVLSSMFFGGISGSAIADTSSIGAMLIPMMRKAGYSAEFAVGITVTSACQGVIIPPSHNVIFYAIAAGGLSVGNLFLGGVVPGIMLGAGLMIMVAIISAINKYPKGNKYAFNEAVLIAKEAFLGIFTAVIIVGRVVSGVFTATESAAFACLYAFIITFFVYREIPL